MEGAPSKFPDWAHLPQLALHSISEKVKSIADYLRFSAVCAPWRSACLPKPGHLPPQLPWLMLPYDPNVGKKVEGILFFYDLWEGKMHKLHLPDTIGKSCCASHRGWLLFTATEGREDVFLLNPLTRARIEFPPFSAQVRYLGEDWDAPRHDAPRHFSLYPGYPESKVIFSCDDPTDPDCLITLYLYQRVIFCCRVGDLCWTIINNLPGNGPYDVTYYNGRFYVLYEGHMVIIDSNKPEERIPYNFEPELQAARMCLLEGRSGVYLVGMKALIEEGEEETYDLYQLQEQPLKLKKIADTSNTTIFNTDFFLAVCSDDWDSLCGGYVYAVWYVTPGGKDEVGYHHSISSAKMDDGKKEQVWDLDKALLIGPTEPVMWFQPSFV